MKRIFLFLPFLLVLIFGAAVSAQNIEMVHIPDKNLEQAIREEIGISDTIPLTPAHMKMLTRLVAFDLSITDITGLEYAANLQQLDLRNNKQLSDIRPIAKLKS